MKTAVSIPDDVFEAADVMANRLGYNRSQLYTRAVRRYLEDHGEDPVTAALDQVNDQGSTEPANIGRQLIDTGAWQW